MPYSLLAYQAEDAKDVIALFRAAVLAVDEALYPLAQKEAWASRATPEEWADRLNAQYVWLAKTAENLLGFCALNVSGSYIDFLYVHPKAQGQGIGGMMLAHMLDEAARIGADEVRARASLASFPLFLRYGFSDDGADVRERNGLLLPFHYVSKALKPTK
ncbi:GNAT family N-acetyltransferase [Suttonella sp. R2A3]|uniref:GNAT family N-acetyltransferase n=1 Tax=Suttonella sp. R2A3 TaxID=2908648 RepID=UPI001F2F319E|nr:GNAT family N-acetyltransferase [Suttonella sp. R2A3]UJF24744.1 GNAT family N-acetyltransferase [Suttonella sp. R2A3]